MSNGMYAPEKDPAPSQEKHSERSSADRFKAIFSIPPPLRWLFEHVPITTYAPNCLPQRSPIAHDVAVLYMFTRPGEGPYHHLSFNPSCLKWQVRRLNNVRTTCADQDVRHISNSITCRTRHDPRITMLLLPAPCLLFFRQIHHQGYSKAQCGQTRS